MSFLQNKKKHKIFRNTVSGRESKLKNLQASTPAQSELDNMRPASKFYFMLPHPHFCRMTVFYTESKYNLKWLKDYLDL